MLWPIKLASQMRVLKFSPIITECVRTENLVSPSIDTEDELKYNYLGTIVDHGHASAALGTWYETIITEHETN